MKWQAIRKCLVTHLISIIMTELKWTDCSSNWWMSANRRLQGTFNNNVWIPVFEKLWFRSKGQESSCKMDTKTNVDSQTTLKPHNNMYKVILYNQLLLEKFIHNFLLGEMQMFFFFYFHRITVRLWQIERGKPQPPEITILSSALPVSLASSGISLTVDTCTHSRLCY